MTTITELFSAWEYRSNPSVDYGRTGATEGFGMDQNARNIGERIESAGRVASYHDVGYDVPDTTTDVGDGSHCA